MSGPKEKKIILITFSLVLIFCLILALCFATIPFSVGIQKINTQIHIYLLCLGRSVFLLVTSVINRTFTLQMTKGIILNNPKYLKEEKLSGHVRFCDGKHVKDLVKSFYSKRNNKTILVIDLGVTNCKALISDFDLQHADLAGLIVLDSAELDHQSVDTEIKSITRYAVISVLHEDVDNFLKSVHRQNPSLDLWFDTFEKIFDDAELCFDCKTGGLRRSIISCGYQGTRCQELARMEERKGSFINDSDIFK